MEAREAAFAAAPPVWKRTRTTVETKLMTRSALMLRAMFCLACAAAAGRCAAAIPVSGIADK